MKTRSQHFIRTSLIAALAMLLLAMQMLGQFHRVLHSTHVGQMPQELWLVVANGGAVSADAWNALYPEPKQSSARSQAIDPWHHHDSENDCAQFDALCLGDMSDAKLTSQVAVAPFTAIVSRSYVARIEARFVHARARAPPRA